jgi:hypothetical protein
MAYVLNITTSCGIGRVSDGRCGTRERLSHASTTPGGRWVCQTTYCLWAVIFQVEPCK